MRSWGRKQEYSGRRLSNAVSSFYYFAGTPLDESSTLCKAALHSTHISVGVNEVYDHIKHLKGGHTLKPRLLAHICINTTWSVP